MPTLIERPGILSHAKDTWPYPILPEVRPHGLKGDLIADRWEFESGRRHRPLKMPWTKRMANGYRLNHKVNAKYWELARRYFTACRNGITTGKPIAVKTCIGMTYALLLIIDHVMRSGASSLWTFPIGGLDSLLLAITGRVDALKPSKLVRATIRLRYETVRQLYTLLAEAPPGGTALNDGFRFAAFSSSEEVVALSKLIGQEQGATPDAPPEVVFKCLEAAIQYVAYYSDEIIDLYHAAQSLRPKVQTELRSTYRPRNNRKSEIASALLQAVVVRPTWVDGLGTVLKSDLARHLGMHPTVTYKPAFRRLIASAELLLRGAKGPKADEARFILVQAAAKPPETHYEPYVGGELAKRLGLPFTGTVGKFAPWPIEFVGNSKGDRTGLGSVVTYLWTASYLILAAFMCDRESETLSIEADCLVQGIDGCYIKTPNFKTRNVDGGSIILQPCPKVVELAVRVLERLGGPARAEAKSDKLLCITHNMGISVPEESELRGRIVRFAKFTKTDTFGKGQHWHLAPHQLRRFFVTAWLHYYEYGRNFKALSKILDHASLGTTIRYGSRVVQGNALSREQKNLTNRILNDVALGNIFAKGPVAQNWARFVERLRVKALPEDQISEWVDRRSDRNGINVHPMPHGYCLWSKFAGLHAQCLEKSARAAGIPRPRNRKRSCVCGSGCRNFLTTEVFIPFWEHSLERHERLAANPAAPVRYKEASKVGIRIAKSFGATSAEVSR
jgi:hypothetical protein